MGVRGGLGYRRHQGVGVEAGGGAVGGRGRKVFGASDEVRGEERSRRVCRASRPQQVALQH